MKVFSRRRIYFSVVIVVFTLTLITLAFHFVHILESLKQVKCQAENRQLPSPTIYIITPTYQRTVQKAELTRISHTLLLVPNVHWILVEDSPVKTQLVSNFLSQVLNFGSLQFTHLNVPTPSEYKMKSNDPNWLKPRGVLQRNKALEWLRQNRDALDIDGVVYFADDDNTYDLRLFSEMRQTNKVSVWPVALVGGLLVERPLVEDNKVVGWNSVWKPNREYPIDMAGFAVKLKLLLENKSALFSLKVPRGLQETFLLKQLINGISDLEPKANSCTQVLVWHTRTETPKLKQEKKLKKPSNNNIEL